MDMFVTGGRSQGKTAMLAEQRDAALKRGKRVAVSSMQDGKLHCCMIIPFLAAQA